MASVPPGGNGPPGGRGRAMLMRAMQQQQRPGSPGQTSDGRTTSPRSTPSTATARTTPATPRTTSATPTTTTTGSSSDRATAASPISSAAPVQGAGAAGPPSGPAGRSRLVSMMSRLRAAGHDPKPTRAVVSVTQGVTHPTGPQVVSYDPNTGRPLGQGDNGKAFAPIRAPLSPVPRGAVCSPTPPTRGTPSPVPPTGGRPPSRGAISPPPQVPPAGPGRPLSPAQMAAVARGRSSTPPTAGSLMTSGSRPTPTTPSPPPTVSGTSTTTPPVVRRGKEGKKVSTTCNFVKLDVKPGGGMYEYEVKFNPPVDSLRDKRELLLDQQRATIGSATNFNGVTLHLPTKLASEQTICKASLRGKPFKVGIFYKKRRHYSDKEVILFLNNLFRRVMHLLKMVNVKGHMYSPNLSVAVEQHRLEIWPGFITAIDEYEGGIQMLCDASFRVLRTETALDVIRALSRDDNFRDTVVKALLKSVVLTRYNNKTYIVDDIDFTMNPLSTFRLTKADREISYIDYYREQYGLTISDPKQPMLINRPRVTSVAEQDVEKLIVLVPELVNMTGITEAMKNNFTVMTDIGKVTRLNPEARQQALGKFVQDVNSTPETKALLENWGLRLNNATVPLEGRVLDPEVLIFGGGQMETVAPNADWTRRACGGPVLTACNLDHWIIIFPKKFESIVKRFYDKFMFVGPKLGIQVAMPQGNDLPNDRIETYLKAVRGSVKPNTSVVVCIFPQQRADRYAAIKKLCYIEKPVASQVILAKTLSNEKKLDAVVKKVALQINCKLGGELWGVKGNIKGHVMVVGIDAYHDADLRAKGCSIAGVVSNINSAFSRWYSYTAKQEPKQEIGDALKVAFLNCLKTFYRHNQAWPDLVVVYRDGVSDTQLNVVQEHEVPQFLSCFKEMNNGHQPKFAYVVVQKRINTRLYNIPRPGQYDNPAPGTVVDYHITRRAWYDFFLVSQRVTQGTVTPVHFVVICDTANIPPDVLQKLSYKLTHMYFNWTGTVRVPAPCQYAHKLADMVGQHLKASPVGQEEKLFYL